jgi:predicted ATPase/signal transduction histidine kinase
MINKIPGYKLVDVIFQNKKTLVYRGIRESDQKSVIIKTLSSEYPDSESIENLIFEYEITKTLQTEGIVQVCSIERSENSIALVKEDFNGETLNKYINNIKIIDSLKVGIQISSILGYIHEAKIIHKDINPSNILIKKDLSEVKITDFNISTRLIQEIQLEDEPLHLNGTLEYISPEQTGRMNRSIDYRTDFYSLGVTLYEMLTGQLPFLSQDPLELIHCHIAQLPVPPYQINSNIPESLSKVVLKLLSKQAEDRYQSAFGVKSDLEICFNILTERNAKQNFIVGELDHASRFIIPQKLYGRSQEINTILSIFEDISNGTSQILLISGYAGIGKTSIINEINKSISQEKGHYISGKYEKLNRDKPFSAIVQAFQSLIKQILTKPLEEINDWKQNISQVLRHNGQSIINFIPEVKLIIGPQEAILNINKSEFQNQFNQIFKDFIKIFAQPDNPLVIFLDDLQWADLDSLKLIELLANDIDSKYTMIIGSYRDSELEISHALVSTIRKLQNSKTNVEHINLKELKIHDVNELISDTIHVDSEQSYSLSELVFNKTGGNPFFLNQLLNTLYDEKLIKFNYSQKTWQFDIHKIQSTKIYENNVIELVVRNLHKLTEPTQEILKLASCLGNTFSQKALALIGSKPEAVIAANIWSAIQAGLIVPLTSTYKYNFINVKNINIFSDNNILFKPDYQFIHDRIQQACYSLIPENQKQKIHLRIGQALLSNLKQEMIEENIFNIVNPLNIARELISDQTFKNYLAKLNLKAAKRAKASAAYETANKYLNIGLELLSHNCWDTEYELSIELHIEAIETEFVNSDITRMFQLLKIIEKKSKNTSEKLRAYDTIISHYFSANEPNKAILYGLDILARLGIKLPRNPNKFDVFSKLIWEKINQDFHVDIDKHYSLPLMNDSNKISAMKILSTIIPATFVAMPTLYPFIILTMLKLSSKYGNSVISCLSYSSYGIIHCGILGDFESGFKYGNLALKLLTKFNDKTYKAKVFLIYNAFICHWKEPINSSLEPLQEGFYAGIDTGDIEHACHCAVFYSNHLLMCGESLLASIYQQNKFSEIIKSYNKDNDIIHLNIWSQFAENLSKNVEQPSVLSGNKFNEYSTLKFLYDTSNGFLIFSIHVAKLTLCFIFNNHEQALQNAELAEKYSEHAIASIYVPIYTFYHTLALISQYESVIERKKATLKSINKFIGKLKVWAKSSPSNYQSKYFLSVAERSKLFKQHLKAAEYYDFAIDAASKASNHFEAALSNELAAEFYFSLNKPRIAEAYIKESYSKYSLWGALSKVQDLETRYPQIFKIRQNEHDFDTTRTINSTSTSKSTFSKLDSLTVLKASQAISEELVLDKLLNKLMKILIESAGAQTGSLILARENKLELIASSSVNDGDLTLQHSISIENATQIPSSIINYVARTQEIIILKNATDDSTFFVDPYINQHQPKSILCLPMVNQGKLVGIIYLENNLAHGAFRGNHLEILKLLCAQAGISLDNAQLYNDLKESKAREQAEKEMNEMKSRFLSIASHEFRTPLTTILGTSDLIKHYGQNWTQDKRITYLERINNNVQNMVGLLDEILFLSKGEAGKTEIRLELINLIEFCQESVDSAQLGAKSGQTINFSFPDKSVNVSLDRKLLQHILVNLLSNAVKYSFPESVVRFDLLFENDEITFQIQDKGIGIPEEDLNQLFESFHRAKNVGKLPGSGLGLSIVKQSVNLHGGKINVQSQENVGTTFTVVIPVREPNKIVSA